MRVGEGKAELPRLGLGIPSTSGSRLLLLGTAMGIRLSLTMQNKMREKYGMGFENITLCEPPKSVQWLIRVGGSLMEWV